MTGLKSGSGDDLWSDESDEEDKVDEADEKDAVNESEAEPTTDATQQTSSEENEQTEETTRASTTDTISDDNSSSSQSSPPSASSESTNRQQPYIVRRAVQDKSVQFERDERLTFFVHDDVVDGERELITEVESELGRSVPKFDVREAVYRAALKNRDNVLEELLELGYSIDEE